MNDRNGKKTWERTNVTNLLRNGQSGIYYGRVKVSGKEKWKSLKTAVFSVAKLRLGDFEKDVRAQGVAAATDAQGGGSNETNVGRFIEAYRAERAADTKLAVATKDRGDRAVKALEKTWPNLRSLDARKVTPADCQQWANRAMSVGTGFVAPKAKTVRRGMSASSFNKCLEALQAVLEIARKNGVAYRNPAEEVSRARLERKRLDLPSVAQFRALVDSIANAGARQSKDCADMVRLLAFSGMRLGEAVALRWRHVDDTGGLVTIPGTKTASSYRIIPIFPPLASLLHEIAARRKAAGMAVSPESAVLAVNECKGALRSACHAIGVKRMTHHDLRHLFATRCIESGVDIPTVSRWLGHSDGGALAMRTYGHLRQEHSVAQATKVSF